MDQGRAEMLALLHRIATALERIADDGGKEVLGEDPASLMPTHELRDRLIRFKERYGVSDEQLAEWTGLQRKTIHRIRHSEGLVMTRRTRVTLRRFLEARGE